MGRKAHKKPDEETFRWICDRKMGNKSLIAKGLECSRSSLNKWLSGDEKLREIYEETLESKIDFTESQLLLMIQGIAILDKDKNIIGWKEKPSETLIKFFLETKGKDRGYGKQQELIHSGNAGFNFNIILPKNDTDEGEENGD